jgi:hypothetical protein
MRITTLWKMDVVRGKLRACVYRAPQPVSLCVDPSLSAVPLSDARVVTVTIEVCHHHPSFPVLPHITVRRIIALE